MFKAFIGYKTVLFVQGIFSLFFLALLLKLNKTIDTVEAKIESEKQRRALLLAELAVMEKSIYLQNTVSAASSSPTAKFDTLPKFPPTVTKSEAVAIVKNKIPATETPKPNSSTTVEYTDNVPLIVAQFRYSFPEPIHISQSQDVDQINGILWVKYNESKIPEEIKLTTNLKEIDAETGKETLLTFYKVETFITPDSTFKCVYREKAAPSQNEFGFPNYQRMLTFLLSGSLKSKVLDGIFTWQEVTGRPVYAKMKVTLNRN